MRNNENNQQNAIAKNFEQNSFRETEQKYCPTNLKLFDELRQNPEYNTVTIQQTYLSHPEDTYSLRLRETVDGSGTTTYTATLKGPGEQTPSGISRMEVETEIDQTTYEFYMSRPLPTIRKMRTYVAPHITIDWCEGVDEPVVEIETANHEEADQQTADFALTYGSQLYPADFANYSMQEIAYRLHDQPIPELPPTITPDILAEAIKALRRESTNRAVVIGITGRSGAGKSHTLREIADILSPHFTISVLSTDDYNRGETAIRQQLPAGAEINWDAPYVYDTERVNYDIQTLQENTSVFQRNYNFATGEPELTGDMVRPADIIIVEGIYAHSPDIATDARFRLETPLATSCARRILRDMRERPSTSDPQENLRMFLQNAEPAFRAQFPDVMY